VNGPLDGYRVVELGAYVAGPGVSSHLADLGAEVIKIESQAGDAARQMGAYGDAIWASFNRNKRSIALDLKDPRGRDIALELIDTSDVLVQNLRPGGVSRLGLDPETTTTRNPRLVYLSVTGYNSAGPNGRRLGLDIGLQAESGMMSLTGEEGGDPMRVGYPIVDVASTHVATEAILAALLSRSATDRGRIIEMSMFDVALSLQSVPLSTFFSLGREQGRRASGSPYNAPASDIIDTRDGQLVISAHVDHWARLCRVIGRPDLIDDPRFATNDARVANRTEMLRQLSDALSEMDSESAADLLARNSIVVGVVRSYPQLVSSREFRHGNFVVEAQLPDGSVAKAIRPAFSFADEPARESATLPALGGDTRSVLAELGRSDDEIAELERARVAFYPGDSR
jgi:crotonobetainyl-CoA:carnitine CoA-transferase CaiB-like acyl-CoA transferase